MESENALETRTPEEIRAWIRDERTHAQFVLDLVKDECKQCLREAEEALRLREAYLTSLCPHKDDGGFIHGFCEGCGAFGG